MDTEILFSCNSLPFGSFNHVRCKIWSSLHGSVANEPLAWGLPFATGVALKSETKTTKPKNPKSDHATALLNPPAAPLFNHRQSSLME